jgi:hypothetical protein
MGAITINPVDVQEHLTDAEIVNLTQNTRIKLVNQITKDGATMPDDRDEREVLLAALRDLNGTSMNRMKLAADKQKGNDDRAAALMVASILGQAGSANPYQSTTLPANSVLEHVDFSQLPTNVALVDGEGETGISTERYDGFTQRVEGV